MVTAYWNDWYSGWGWVLWFGVMILASVGNWGYTYRVHRSQISQPRKEAFDILNERCARGEITAEEHARMESTITTA